MPVGFEAYNDAGEPQTIDGTHNIVLIQTGTVTIASNTAATGASASVALPARGTEYIVFIRTNASNTACILTTTSSSFTWFMPQGSTTFDWYAYSRGAVAGNSGVEVYNADGSLRWSLTQRPLILSSTAGAFTGTMPTIDQWDTRNVITVGTATIPSGHAIATVHPGYHMDVYTGFPGPTAQADSRYWMTYTANGTTLTRRWGRRRANPPNPYPAGVSRAGTFDIQPLYIFTAAV